MTRISPCNLSLAWSLVLMAAAMPLLGPAQAVAQAPTASVTNPGQTTGRASRFVVVLDAAHGGEDGGAQLAGATAEKTVTLALSVRLRSLLTARGFQVVTTREGNVNLDAINRAQVANRAALGAGGAACLSFHATQAGAGVHLFVSSLAPMPVSSGRFLAWKTAQAAYVARSLKLAGTVNSALEHGGDSGPIASTLGRASLPEMDSMVCPAVAIEVAPVRGDDRKVVTEVTDAQYQTQIVEALAAALLEWKTDWETERTGGQAGGQAEVKTP